MAARNIALVGAVYPSVPSVLLPVQGGGTASFVEISDTTATADKILSGYGAYGADGQWMDGTATAGGGSAVTVVDTLDANGGTIRTITAVSLAGDTVTAEHLESGYTAHDALGNAITGSLTPGITPSGTVNITSAGTTDVTNYAYASVASGTATTPATSITATPTISVSSSGLITATVSASKSVTPTVSSGYVSSGTSGTVTVSGSATEQMTARSSSDLTASTLTVTAPSGYYASAATKTLTDANLTAGNIKKDVSIFGVTGTLEGGASSWTKIGSTSELFVNTTSTTASSAGTVSLGSGHFNKDKIIWVRIRDKNGKRDGYFYGSDAYFMNYRNASGSTSSVSAPAVVCYRYSNSAYGATSGQYGVYGYSIDSSGTLTIRRRYNSTNTLTINSTYTIDVYELTPPTGVSIFA